MPKTKIICLVGPTGVGKTELSIKIAKHFNFNVISGDSMQVYKGMDIGTGKITESEMDGVRHEMIDILSPDKNFSVKEFQELVTELIDKEYDNNNTPFIVGGTAFYIHALINDFQFNDEDEAEKLELVNYFEQFTNEALHEKVKEINEDVHINNRKRMIRVLIKNKLGQTKRHDTTSKYDALIIGLYDDREKLYERINTRVLNMIDNGLEKEVRYLFDHYKLSKTALGAIGYHEFIDYFNGDKSLEIVIKDIQRDSRRYAKRQLTYLRNKLDVEWFKVGVDESDILNRIESFLKKSH